MTRIMIVLSIIAGMAQLGICQQHDSFDRFELEGLLSFSSYSHDVQLQSSEEIGVNLFKAVYMGVGGTQYYRSHSVSSTWYLNPAYRFFISKITLPVGALVGFKRLRIGMYHQTIPVIGLDTGIHFDVSPHTTLRITYRFLSWFDDQTVIGNEIMAGLGYSFMTITSH